MQAYPETPSIHEWMLDVEIIDIVEDSLDLIRGWGSIFIIGRRNRLRHRDFGHDMRLSSEGL